MSAVSSRPITPRQLNFRQFLWLWNRLQRQRTPSLHLEIAAWLDRCWETGERRLLLLSFRSTGKSTLLGAFCAWLLLRNPDLRILVLSAEYDLAKKMVRNVKTIVERHLLTRPLVPSRLSHWAADEFTINRSRTLRDPSLLARGISSNITGSRADVVICDDVEVPNTCRTSARREELRERLREINYVLMPGGLQLFAGTPHSRQSIYAATQDVEDDEEPPFLAGFERLTIPLLDASGKSRWPERFPTAKIEEIRRQTGPIKFESQMMLRPTGDEDIRLNPAQLIRYQEPLQVRESNGQTTTAIGDRRMVAATGWWDPSFGLPDRGDASVVAAVFVDDDGHYWLHGIRYLTHDPKRSTEIDEATQLCRQVATFVSDFGLNRILVENNGIGRFLPAILRRELAGAGIRCSVLEQVSARNKEERILEAFDPILAARALHVHADVWRTPFIAEMRDWRPGQASRDDGLDAVSGCILAEPVRLARMKNQGHGCWHARSDYRVLGET
jgi:hypothetical protein